MEITAANLGKKIIEVEMLGKELLSMSVQLVSRKELEKKRREVLEAQSSVEKQKNEEIQSLRTQLLQLQSRNAEQQQKILQMERELSKTGTETPPKESEKETREYQPVILALMELFIDLQRQLQEVKDRVQSSPKT